MTEERWQHLKDLLQAAWAMDADERPAFLDRICGQDAKLRSNVEALLASDQNIGEFLALPAIHSDWDLGAEDFSDYWQGRHVGPYQILREIGHGGMGTVYLAERADGQYQKQVAIKLVNPQFGDRHFLRRFLRERQVLAGLEHPNVVRLLDGGATEDGLPYLVLEHVEGVRIDIWCESHKLPVRDCIRLFRNVCAAVEYAHRKDVVHLDIKPGNILVTADGVPKLLDFGVARALNPERFAENTETSPGQLPMTPEYASPEQARGGPMGPATDIYALGLVLHRLLTGHLPHTTGPPERELNADLHSIVLKALHQEPRGRYVSATELSDDLDRFLHDRPVRARKATFAYRGRKLVKRNRLAASLAAVLFTASIVVMAVSRARSAASPRSIEVRPANVQPPGPPAVPPAVPLPVPEAPAAPKSLAVVYIENRAQGASPERVELGLCDLLTANLAISKGIRVISADRVRELVGRRVQGDSRLPAVEARDVAREAQADLFLSGSLTQAGTQVRLEFQVQETKSGRVLFGDLVEGTDLQAIFTIAAEASARILSRLAPGETASKSMAGAALTANLEALTAYAEGLNNRTRFRPVEARTALQRAIDLDPQFVMAHYHLADSMRFDGNVPEARRSIARAVQLADDAPVPRLQRMLAQALQMRLDFRLEEAARILEATHREFPQETDPLYQLANIRSACARFGEAAALLEKVVRMDGRHALAHDQLGYQYAFLGDVGRAIASIDRYAALLPLGNEAPFCSRGDAYMINERYGEALEQYRKIDYRGPMAMAALHAGDYGPPDALLQKRRNANNLWFGLLGDLAAARGQLDQAAPNYESAVTQYQSQGPLRPWFALLSAARIHLEQSRPEDVLALGRRHDHPWAAGLRGTAYLLLHQEAEAEKEFTALRHSIGPILGDYVADETVEFHRMQAASCAGRFDRVIEMWPRLPRSWWSLYALDVGRAYLHAGVFTEAEHHLRLARKAQQAFFMNGDMQAQHNLLTWMLAGFYLAQVLEKTGRRAEAIAYYQDFVEHFENSAAALPQPGAARAVLARLRLSERGKLVFSEEFSGNRLEAGQVRRLIPYHDAVFELSFRIENGGQIGFGFSNEHGQLAGILLDSRLMILEAADADRPGGLNPRRLDRAAIVIEPGKIHKVVVEVHGTRILAHLDDRLTVAGESPALDVDKTRVAVSVTRANASFDYVRMYEVAPR
jgi:serine/threonine protein kinase/TolB-like protein